MRLLVAFRVGFLCRHPVFLLHQVHQPLYRREHDAGLLLVHDLRGFVDGYSQVPEGLQDVLLVAPHVSLPSKLL